MKRLLTVCLLIVMITVCAPLYALFPAAHAAEGAVPAEIKLLRYAQALYDDISIGHHTAQDYRIYQWNQKEFYRDRLAKAKAYNFTYDYFINISAALLDIGIGFLTGDAGKMLGGVAGMYIDVAYDEIMDQLKLTAPMSVKDYIYAQAASALNAIELSTIEDVMERAQNNGGRLVSYADAAELVYCHLRNKLHFSTLALASTYYDKQLSEGPNGAIRDLLVKISLSEIAGHVAQNDFVLSTMEDFLMSFEYEFLDGIGQQANEPCVSRWVAEQKSILAEFTKFSGEDSVDLQDASLPRWISEDAGLWTSVSGEACELELKMLDGGSSMQLYFPNTGMVETAIFAGVDGRHRAVYLDAENAAVIYYAGNGNEINMWIDLYGGNSFGGSSQDPTATFVRQEYAWVAHWVNTENPETVLDITSNGDGTLHLAAHFAPDLSFAFDFPPVDYELLYFDTLDDPFPADMRIDGKTGMLEFNLYADQNLGGWLNFGWLGLGSSLYDRIAQYAGTYFFTTENPPDLTRFGWIPYDEPDLLTEEEARQLFARLSETPLMAASGAGAWEGRLKVNADGTFTGVYGDADADMVYQSFFSGCFNWNVEVYGHTYWLWVEELTTQQEPGTRGVDEYGDPVTYTEAPFYAQEYMVLTWPGTPEDEIPEMVRGEIGGTFDEWEDYSRFITLTRWDDGWGFFADPNDPPAYDPQPDPAYGDDEPAASWTGIWQARQSGSRLYIFREEGGSGDYQVIHTMQKNGETRAIRGSLYFLDEITMDYDVPGIVHGAIVGDPYGSTLSLTPFSAVDERMRSWMQVIEDEYEYIASLDDPARQIDPSIWDLIKIGLDPIAMPAPTAAPTQAPTPAKTPYAGNGQVLVDDEICTIVNLGKEMRPANGDLYPRPRYRLAVVNHYYVPIYIQPGKVKADASVPGLTLGTVDGNGLDNLLFDENGQRDYQNNIITVPPDEAVEMVLEPVAYGYGFRSIDELVNTDVFINVGYNLSAWQVREYELRMDEGPAYPRPAIQYYSRGGTVTLDLTFEIPDTWKLFYEINGELFEGNLESEDLVKYLKGELSIAKHYLPPPSPNNCAALVRTHFGTTPEREANGYEGLPGYNRLDDIMIDGQRACVVRYQMPDTLLIVCSYFLTNQDGSVTEIETVSDGSDVSDAIIQRLVNSIRFTIYGQEPATPAPTAAPDLSAWTGYWMTHDDSLAEMIITDNGNGTLHAQAMFLPAGNCEAILTPQRDGSMRFEEKYGNLKGQMQRMQDGGLYLTITGGSTMEDEEATEYQGYYGRGFAYYPTTYAEMWYQFPEDAVSTESDWVGIWSIMGGAEDSRLFIAQERDGLRVDISMGPYHFSGMGELAGDSAMDLYSDDFSCLMLLNKKLNRIAMMEVGSDIEAVYDWAVNPYYGVIIYQRGDYRINVPDELRRDDLPPVSIMPVPTAPGATQSIAHLPTPTPPPEPTGAVRLLSIPGKQGYLQVPVSRVDATSYIVSSKDPAAYAPFRMIDGEETTSFQFSTKTTKLGQAYLYFDFAAPVTLDEMWMKNGFWKITDGKDQYTRNSRVKKMTIDVLYAGESGYKTLKTVSLKDDKARKDWKVIDMLGVRNVIGVRFRIDEIFTGSKFPNDVCISEIMFVRHAEQ